MTDEERIAEWEKLGEKHVRELFNRGRFNNAKYALAANWLAEKEAVRFAASQAEKKALAISSATAARDQAGAAREANQIAKQANIIATLALIAAIIAIAVSVIALFKR